MGTQVVGETPQTRLCGPRADPQLAATHQSAEVRKNEEGAKPRVQTQSHPNLRRRRKPAFKQKWKLEPPSHPRLLPHGSQPALRGSGTEV